VKEKWHGKDLQGSIKLKLQKLEGKAHD